MTNPAPIEFFRPGKHVDTSGKVVHVTADHLRATAAAYKPELHDAPLVVGHPKMDDPAYGWVKAVQFNEQTQRLEAIPHQVDADFAEIVNDGKYKKVSARFYLPDSPGNPVPGVYYPKHIGFLGATPPAVKGLKSVSFADDAEGVVEFADWDQMTIAGLFRSLRDWIISKDGIETADGILPTYQIESLQINAAQDDEKPRNISFSETSEPGEPMTPQEQAQFDALKAQVQTLTTENQTLAVDKQTLTTQVASFAEAQKQNLHLGHLSFAEGLIKAGKLLPADKDATVAMLDQLAGNESTVEFGEGDGKQSQTPLAIYKAQLEKAPVLVNFGEYSNAGDDDGTASFAAPDNLQVDQARLDLHNKATAYAEKNGVSYTEALTKV